MSLKHFLLLLGVTAAVTVAAIFVTLERSKSLSGVLLDRPFFEGLRGRLNDVKTVEIASPEEAFLLEWREGSWVLPTKYDYPALDTLTKPFLLALSDLTIRERKTADPDLHGRLDLRDRSVSGSRSTRVTLKDNNDAVIADVLFGREGPRQGQQTRQFYVRTPGEAQTWLVEGDVTLRPTILDWIDRSVLNIPRSAIERVVVTPPQGAPYQLVINSQSSGADDFTLSGLKDGETVGRQFDVNAIAGGLQRLTHDDLRPDMDSFTPVWAIVFTLKDESEVALVTGLVPGEEGASGGEALWTRLTFRGESERFGEAPAKTKGFLFDLGEASRAALSRARPELL